MTSWVNYPHKIHGPVKFGNQKPCGIGDIKLLICHITSRDNVFRKSCDIMGGCCG